MNKGQKKKYIDDLMREWIKKLFLGEWQFNVAIKLKPYEANKGRWASCLVNKNYFEADINIYPPYWDDRNDKQRKDILVHELCHCHTSHSEQLGIDLLNGILRTRQEISDENEQLTQRLTNIALGV